MKRDWKRLEIVLLVGLLVFLGTQLINIAQATNIIGENYANVSLLTTVNVTSSAPEFISVIIDEEYNTVAGSGTDNITLGAGATRKIYCNATVRDWDGIDDNITLNASFFFQGNSTVFDADLNSTHYSNTSCTLLAGSPYGQNNAYGNYTCTFDVYYWAENGTWNCTMFAVDVRGPVNYTRNETNTTSVNPLYALNVTDGIDYGDMAVGDTSSNITANVTNFGNMAINLTVQGYGENVGDNLALACNDSVSAYNISVDNEAVSVTEGLFESKMLLDGTIQDLPNITISKPNDTDPTIVESTYWQLRIPETINPSGVCSGWVVFSATSSS